MVRVMTARLQMSMTLVSRSGLDPLGTLLNEILHARAPTSDCSFTAKGNCNSRENGRLSACRQKHPRIYRIEGSLPLWPTMKFIWLPSWVVKCAWHMKLTNVMLLIIPASEACYGSQHLLSLPSKGSRRYASATVPVR